MAEQALTYVITLVIVGNVAVIGTLAAIVALLPRTTRRRPAHRAEVPPSRRVATLSRNRPIGERRTAIGTPRAA